MIQLAALDYVWMFFFTALMIVLAFVFYKLASRSQSDFFLAGRGLPWWLPATSVYATHTATDTPMWFAGTIYKYGMRGIWFSFFTVWCAISAFISSKIYRRSLAYTQAEWQTIRFSGPAAEMLRGGLAGWQIFMNAFILGWVGAAMGNVCRYIFGWDPMLVLLGFSIVCAAYVLAAGYWGAVMAEFQQGIIVFAVILIVSLWGVGVAGGPDAIVDKLVSSGQGWRLDPFAFSGWFSGDFPVMMFITLIVFGIGSGFGMGVPIDWYAEAQRVQSAKTVKDGVYSLWSGSLLIILRNGLWAAALLGFFVLFPNLTNSWDYEMGWFRLGFDYMPVGLVGFFFAGILAIHLSTLATSMNLGALYATRDLYHHYYKPKATEKELVGFGRLSTAAVVLISCIMGWIILQGSGITDWLLFALFDMTAGIWLAGILQVVWWRFNAKAYLVSWIANIGVGWLVVWILPGAGIIPKLPQWASIWAIVGITAAIYIPVALLTKPDDIQHLAKFYAMTRPIGFWGPVRKEAERLGLLEPAYEKKCIDVKEAAK